MVANSAVDLMHADISEVRQAVDQAVSPSALASLGRIDAKVLLISAASALEDQVKESLGLITREAGGDVVGELIDHAILSRGYHTLFNWGGKDGPGRSANSFFALFGEEVAERCKSCVAADPELAQHISDFLELGYYRNKLVHSNFASFGLQKTYDEVMKLYLSARQFPAILDELLMGDSRGRSGNELSE